jgi:homogentisate 1,2-dioxygenase
MPNYHRLGVIPPKRHTQFRDPSGRLYHEELIGIEGFSGLSSLLYHAHPPTQVLEVRLSDALPWQPAIDRRVRHRHLRTRLFEPKGDPVTGRRPLL